MFDIDSKGRIEHAAVLGSVVLAAALALGGCKSEGGSAETAGGEESATAQKAEQAQGDESKADKGAAGGEIGPKGPPSIDHGGITSVPENKSLVKKGEKLFSKKGCTACHKMTKRLVGPPLKGVTERREPEWIAKMIMHPDKMLKKDPQAKKLLAEYMTPMANQGITADEAKALIAFFGTKE